MEKNSVLAMYDVRGIQSYIFRTSKVKDAMGASVIVEDILMEVLKEAVRCMGCGAEASLEWRNNSGELPYQEDDARVKVLYVGGGNAYVIYESEDLCIAVNRHMARLVLEKSYSLQLAVAHVSVTGDYARDYRDLHTEMDRVKSAMTVTRPYGVLPIMKMELETGYPAVQDGEDGYIGTETILKKSKKESTKEQENYRLVKNLEEKKGVDSTLAVVHIDGNNMGIRIRKLLEGSETYVEAVNLMRKISYNIRTSYRTVFDDMCNIFETECRNSEVYREKMTDQFIRKILVAGDDITYVCSSRIALATVEYFCREIGRRTMTGETGDQQLREYGFSVCAGVAYVGSHFPFSSAYEAAEACCESAKSRAKRPENMDGTRVGNFVDFQICKNIQVKNLEAVRWKEYRTYAGENLLTRPYWIQADADGEAFAEKMKTKYAFHDLKKYIKYFRFEERIPMSFAQELRNTYPLGQPQVEQLASFLASRGFKMPDGTTEMYRTDPEGPGLLAVWYDALEMMDHYIDLQILRGEENAG